MNIRKTAFMVVLASATWSSAVSAQPLPEIEPYRPTRKMFDFSPGLVSPPVEVFFQFGSGWMTTMMFSGIAYFGAYLKSNCSSDYRCELLGATYLPAVVNHVAIGGTAVWGVGKLNGSQGSYLATIWGSALGSAVGLGIHFARGRDACIMLTREGCDFMSSATLLDGMMLSVWPALGGIVAYQFSAKARRDARAHQSAERGPSWSLSVAREERGGRLSLSRQF